MTNLEEYETVNKWLSRLSQSTRNVNIIIFSKFMEYLKQGQGKFNSLTPDELVEFQKNASNGELYDILDEIQGYINSQQNIRYNSLRKYYSTLRSFFAHNRVELPRDKSYRVKSEVPQVRGLLTPEEVRSMALASKPRYKAIFLSLLQGGMGLEEFDYWNKTGWPSLKDQLARSTRLVRVDLPGRKMKKHTQPYYTFLGRDAVDAIRNYVEHFRPDKTDAIFYDQNGNPVSKGSVQDYWKRLSYRVGLVKPQREKDLKARAKVRHGKNLHELRDTFRTLWSKSSAKYFIGEFFMGHTIDPQNYDKSSIDVNFYEKEYLKAESLLNIMSSAKPYGQVEEDRVLDLERQNEELREKMKELETPNLERFEDLASQVVELRKQLEAILQK
jgi:hypothetical protein